VTAAGRSLDRASTTLGAVAVASAVFVVVRGDFSFIRVRGDTVAMVLALGLLAIVAGRRASRALTLAAGAGFLASAAVVLLALVTRGESAFLDVDGSTLSFCVGLGVGLLLLGLAHDQPRTSTP